MKLLIFFLGVQRIAGEAVSKDSLELSITERIWGVLQEVVIAIATIFGLNDEDIYDAIINRTEEMNHICDIYKLKLAC